MDKTVTKTCSCYPHTGLAQKKDHVQQIWNMISNAQFENFDGMMKHFSQSTMILICKGHPQTNTCLNTH